MEKENFESPLELVHLNTSGPRPTSQFDLIEDGKKIGMLQLRHTLSGKSDAMPEGFESNVYYEIESEYQHSGYGKKILTLGLDEARKIGLTEVILTCYEDNIPSQKIIEANGGVVINNQLDKEGAMVRLYKINLGK